MMDRQTFLNALAMLELEGGLAKTESKPLESGAKTGERISVT
jgi:hypothetical protein